MARRKRNQRQVNQELNFKPEISGPGMWQFPTNLDLCCIYRVPHQIRQTHPRAYTPQLVILGPLHHSLKAKASKCLLEDPEKTRFMGYLSMEQHKEIYLLALAQRFDQEDIITRFRSVIVEEEDKIRASYSESTTWIETEDFIKMILHDSVFILEFFLRILERRATDENENENTGDILMDHVSLRFTVSEDLTLLENQLPFFILQKVFEPIIGKIYKNATFRKIVLRYFGFQDKIKDNSQFKHFTDLLRCVHVNTLTLKDEEVNGVQTYKHIEYMSNAEKLHRGGIKFKVIENELSLDVKFENGCLELPRFRVHHSKQVTVRNIMALEQCHYPNQAYVCNYILFLDYLIDTDKDVDILLEKGIIKHWIGDQGSVATIVNEFSSGTIDSGSYYYDIAVKLEAHYKNPINKSCALLNRVYFNDMWTGTATIAAIFLLLMTLSQTITSLIQVL